MIRVTFENGEGAVIDEFTFERYFAQPPKPLVDPLAQAAIENEMQRHIRALTRKRRTRARYELLKKGAA